MPEEINQVEALCMRCHKKQPIKDPYEVEMIGKGGSIRRALRGVCSVCGCKMFKFLPKKKESPKEEEGKIEEKEEETPEEKKESPKVAEEEKPDIAKEISDFDQASQIK